MGQLRMLVFVVAAVSVGFVVLAGSAGYAFGKRIEYQHSLKDVSCK